MKLFFFPFLLILLASCGTMSPNGNLRFVKVGQKEVPVIEKNTVQIDAQKEKENKNQEIQEEHASIDLNLEDPADSKKQVVLENTTKNEKEHEDLLPDEDEEDINQQIVNQAFKAERQAKNSVGLFGAGLISIFMPYLGILFYIAGLIVYSNAKSSRYITPLGEERLRTSKTLLIIDSVILGLWLLLFLLILSILFF